MLLLSANDVVSREALVDVLWGSEPPRSAVQSLQVYVHGLRQALGAERIATHGTGYRLVLADGELDFARFERLAAAGPRALAAGRQTRRLRVGDRLAAEIGKRRPAPERKGRAKVERRVGRTGRATGCRGSSATER